MRHRAWLAWRSPPGLSRYRPVVGLARSGRDGAGAAEMRPGCFGAQPVGMIAGRDDQDGGDVRAGSVHLEQARGLLLDERKQQPVEVFDLGGQVLGSSAELSQGDAGGITDDVTGAGPKDGQLGDEIVGAAMLESGAQIVGASNDKGSGLVDGPGPLASSGSFGHHQRPYRLDRSVPAARRTLGLARQGGSGRAHSVEGVGLARPEVPGGQSGPPPLPGPRPRPGGGSGPPRSCRCPPRQPHRRDRTNAARPAAGRSQLVSSGSSRRRADLRCGRARRPRVSRRGCPHRR